jgi:Protein of unknown function (DUF1579)
MAFSHRLLPLLTVSIAVSTAAWAQDAPGMPKPGPEHQLFLADQGTWDAVVELNAGGPTPMTSKGVQTDVVGCSGLCLVSDFKGEMMGAAFDGHGVTAFDALKKKYVGSWTDTMSMGLLVSESSYDAATKRMTGWMEGPDGSGKVTKSKIVNDYPDKDHKVMTMYTVGSDGKEVQAMRITYTRQSAR